MNPRSIAFLGIGYGAREIAFIGFIKNAVEETIRIMFGGSGWNFDVPAKKITGKNRFDQDIEIEDEEIIEFLTVFALWRSAQTS
jgi:hypothetical protein